jgi:sulfur relay (sulfurtransferase) complex TusBCD TusD component (DsrE family)
MTMKYIKCLGLALALMAGTVTLPALAGDKDPLFVNMTTDDGHRAAMAIGFGQKQFERGHPLTVFLNDRGVFVGSKANAAKFPDQQKTLAELMGKGAAVIACQHCMNQHGVKEGDLLSGIKIGNPEMTGNALFKDNTKTLTW